MSLLTIKIYLGNLIHNYQTLKHKTPHLGAVVKADAYGLGALLVTKTLRKQGCKIFFVATASEGKILRQKFSDIDIYVFDGFIEHKTIIDYALKPVLNTLQQLQEWSQTANHFGAILHIDTGMNRLGISFGDIQTLTLDNTKIDYVMTHFTDSESNFAYTQKQTDMILHSAKYLNIKNISIANSGGILWHTPIQNSYLGRAGIGLYGGIDRDNLRSVVGVSGKILQKKQIPAYEPVGYGSTFITQKPTVLLTIAGGYADGIMRSLSGSDFCGYINGDTIPLVGRVSMDTTIFDASDLSDTAIQEATELEFFGLNNPITKISECAKTIPYEFLTNLSRRANRVIVA